MSIAVERQYLSMQVPLLSVAKGSTRAHEMNGLCGCRVCDKDPNREQLNFFPYKQISQIKRLS